MSVYNRPFLFGIGMTLLLTFISFSGFTFNEVNHRWHDLFFRVRGEQSSTQQVILVDIDRKSLEEIGQWPFPRTDFSKAIQNIRADGALVLGLDMIFPQEDKYSLQYALDQLKEEGWQITAPLNHHTILDNDRYFAEEVNYSRLVLGGIILPTSEKKEGISSDQALVTDLFMENIYHFLPNIRQGSEQVVNTPLIQQQVQAQGVFNLFPDRSGVARSYTMLIQAPVIYEKWIPLADSFEESFSREEKVRWETYPGLALSMHRVARNLSQVKLIKKGLLPVLELSQPGKQGKELVPLNSRGDIPINYLGKSKTHFTYVSFVDVLNDRVPKGTFQGKYVLMGSTDITLNDVISTPYQALFPGVEVHATMLDNLISRKIFKDFRSETIECYFWVILIFGSLLTWITTFCSIFVALFFSVLVPGVIPFIQYILFSKMLIITNFVFPFLSLGVIGGGVVLIRFFGEVNQKSFIQEQFSQMVSPEVLRHLQEGSEELDLQGEKMEVSILFCDLVGFTAFSECQPPKRVVAMLNEYFSLVSDEILSRGGFLDKYIGDAAMACWGAPYSDPEHAYKACQTALAIQKVVKEHRQSFEERYEYFPKTSIGIATGEVAAALVGSEQRKNYTVIGDTVNLGAHLEGACRELQRDILISKNTYGYVKEKFNTEKMGMITFSGKKISSYAYAISIK